MREVHANPHAGPAARATVEFVSRNGWFDVEVADDGPGLPASASSRGTGLVGMADRLGAVRGSLSVSERVGGGVSVRGRVPLGRPG